MNTEERKCLNRLMAEVSYWKRVDTTDNHSLDCIVIGATGALSNVISALYGVDIYRESDSTVSIEDIGLTDRTLNVLLTEGITTYSQLKGLSDMTLLRMSNFGKKSVREIRDVMEQQRILERFDQLGQTRENHES